MNNRWDVARCGVGEAINYEVTALCVWQEGFHSTNAESSLNCAAEPLHIGDHNGHLFGS
jgi:hypothetical protein